MTSEEEEVYEERTFSQERLVEKYRMMDSDTSLCTTHYIVDLRKELKSSFKRKNIAFYESNHKEEPLLDAQYVPEERMIG